MNKSLDLFAFPVIIPLSGEPVGRGEHEVCAAVDSACGTGSREVCFVWSANRFAQSENTGKDSDSPLALSGAAREQPAEVRATPALRVDTLASEPDQHTSCGGSNDARSGVSGTLRAGWWRVLRSYLGFLA